MNLQPPVCRHRGFEFAPGRFSCSSSRLVAPQGVTSEICRTFCPCPDHEVADVGRSAPPRAAGSGYGVAIGTYDSHVSGRRSYGVEAVRLNLAALRSNCGPDLRILVCDDGSPPGSRRRYLAACREYDAEFTSNAERLGHTSGDMAAFYKAVAWGAQLKLRTVTKLSHRMLIDVPSWVQEDSERLIASGYGTFAQILANFGLGSIRTECVMMVVDRWATPETLEHLAPRPIELWNEQHTFDAIRRFVDPDKPFPAFLPWHRINCFRGSDRPPIYFRAMRGDAPAAFRALGRKYGVRLPRHFTLADSALSVDYRR